MKTTKATIKSFVKNNYDKIFINVKSDFDGMTDGIISLDGGFKKANGKDVNGAMKNFKNTLGIDGAWFVGSSRDYFRDYEDEIYKGFEVSNCCGSFILAIQK